MKNKYILFTFLLMLALVSAACSAQNTTSEPGAATTLPTATTGAELATEEATEAAMTPTGSVEVGTPDQGTAETGTTPTGSADSGTPAPESGGSAGIPQTGPGDAGVPDDLDEVMRVLRELGVTVDLGDPIDEADFVSIPGQILFIDGEEVEIYTFNSAEELEAQATGLADLNDPEDEPQFYKMGNMLVRYTGSDPGVRDLLENVLGAQAAGQ
ncbi:MAG TPA: hypothetical protein VFY25_15055 [Anaerolineales bacterium]|nr:hypothetical protein [Anaerolineales bacterium]